MTELNKVLKYLESKPAILHLGELPRKTRTTCFLIHNRIRRAINIDDPRYKTMADLMKEATTSVYEMRGDVELMINHHYKDLYVVDNILFVDALEELASTTLVNRQNCIDYLTDLAVISLIALESNPDKDYEFKLLFDALIYISVITLNLFNSVNSLPLEKEGIAVDFLRRRNRDAG